jgi:RNA polymerase sigma-70 factor (ECF subfamily)
MLTTSEKYLIELIKKGDQKAFEFLFKNYYSDLCKYARNIVLNDATAEDMVMDVFVKIWEAETKLEITTSLSGYLYTSVHNHSLNYLTRKHKRFIELSPETIEILNRLIPASDNSVLSDGINMAELSQRIEKCIKLLPDECRNIFIMSRTDELPNKEIASRLGISENTVKVQIYRAMKKLKLLLKDFFPESMLL